ncbi:rRNA methylase/Hemolysin-tylA [Leptospira biflexa serovar Patoc strain 'Patoc 1 (Ames)']|uniref:Putative ribosomal RNA methyltransferase, putative hemolysine TlyA-like protein n=2 Tax=Leptospira biflexa serovar Patoc TaxID=145259 RepID=B0SJT2_LEPBP|nr:TlyA family RNA methyltransferase [Leptospira biflexa]ABZ92628.1 rRNA methylase/Hemolysin-tylA [Leptospira biflexa serovar Patoc strain 'Patoc 1 (Ames)']ABZ96229.1 Putative ribosomal RNA methyltransferase, putative hemolysine TlyA-like protein [Leptospira biflexa serovar Patoc strain 'Patoc 1 (Paris)']CAJ90434.1 putative ribosomal RNA methyltransferase [Leptospira biflexa serovar Patoc strain 'Patoc 1 (Paris)']
MLKEKIRLDDYLVREGYAKDLKLAQSLILSGSVLVNDTIVSKVGTLISNKDKVRTKEKIKTYVSRGAYKLLGAFDRWKTIQVEGKTCIDLGASTGGFCQVLLEKGAIRVIAVDVGYGQLAQKIANDPKVFVLDRTHLRELPKLPLGALTKETWITMDLSFISLVPVFSHLLPLFQKYPDIHWQGISLFKPQFEVHPSKLEKGILIDSHNIGKTIKNVWLKIKKNDPKLEFLGLGESPIQGADGNREFLIRWERRSES